MRAIQRSFMLLLFVLSGTPEICAQTATTVDAVAAVNGSAALGYQTITGGIPGTSNYVYARGYYQPGESGVGYFFNSGGGLDR